jgi:hypothetical protein
MKCYKGRGEIRNGLEGITYPRGLCAVANKPRG